MSLVPGWVGLVVREGGTHIWKWYRDVPLSLSPFFQASRRSLAYQFTTILEKVYIFEPCFGQNFSSQDANFPNFCSQDSSFFKENLLPRPYFWWRTPTKKIMSDPPRLVATLWCALFLAWLEIATTETSKQIKGNVSVVNQFTAIPSVSKRINSSKNDSELKHMRYLVNYLF